MKDAFVRAADLFDDTRIDEDRLIHATRMLEGAHGLRHLMGIWARQDDIRAVELDREDRHEVAERMRARAEKDRQRVAELTAQIELLTPVVERLTEQVGMTGKECWDRYLAARNQAAFSPTA